MADRTKSAALDGTNRQSYPRTGAFSVVCPTANPSGVTSAETIVYVCRGASDATLNGQLWVHDGASWTIHNLGLGEHPLFFRAVPGTPGTGYMFIFSFNTFTSTIKKTTDYGASFSDIGLPPFDGTIDNMGAASDGYCYAFTSGSSAGASGIFKSNGGAWAQVLAGDDNGGDFGGPAMGCISGVELLWFDTSSNEAYLQGTGSQVNLANPDANQWAGLCKGANGTVLALMDTGLDQGKAYRSTNDGTSWTLEQTETFMGCAGSTPLGMRIQQDPRNVNNWWLLGDVNATEVPPGTKPHVWKSTDDGQTWTQDTPAAAPVDAGTPFRGAQDLWVAS